MISSALTRCPRIAIVIRAKSRLGFQPAKLVPALQEYVSAHLGPTWGVSCSLVMTKRPRVADWVFEILDDSDEPGAEGYHGLTKFGAPYTKVFLRTTKEAHDEPSVTISHELAEMLCDPRLNLGAQHPDGSWYGLEVCDAVEESAFEVGGLRMSNFQYPAWWDGTQKPNSVLFDHLGLCKRPFEILSGGYMPVFRDGKWDQIVKGKRGVINAGKSARLRALKCR